MPYFHSLILLILVSFTLDQHSYRNKGIKKEQRENEQLPCSSKKTFTRIQFKQQEQKAPLITVSTCILCTFLRKCHSEGINQAGYEMWDNYLKKIQERMHISQFTSKSFTT